MSDKTADVVSLVPADRTVRPMKRHFSLVPDTLSDAMRMAEMIAKSDFAPKDYVNKPGNVLVAIQMGLDIGLKPMQALQNIAVINGRPSIWGDAALALVQNSEVIEYVKERFEGKPGADDFTAICEVKRISWPDPVVRTFSIADAKKAGLWTKAGTWQTYPNRMLQMRARSFALRDAAADALMGLSIAEEAQDMPTIEVTPIASHEGSMPDIFLKVPEPMRDNVEKAFSLLELPKGLRLAKLNEFLGGSDIDPELGTQNLLNWCRDEYAARAGRKREPGPQNSKAPQPLDARAHAGDGDGAAHEAKVVEEKKAETVPAKPVQSADIKWGF